MRSFGKQMLLILALATIGSTTSASAFCYMGGDEVREALGISSGQEDEQKPADRSAGESVQHGQLSLVRENQGFGAAPPPDMKIIGLWVGNLSYGVGQSGKNLYIVDPRGGVAPMPAGANADDVCVPMNNAFVRNIQRLQPVPSQESQLRASEDRNGGSGRFIGGGSGMLVPTVVATRTIVANGKPMIVGGPVICELPARSRAISAGAAIAPRAMPTATAQNRAGQARIIPKKMHRVRSRSRK